MKKMTNWEELQWRGLVKDVAGENIEDLINNKSVTFYWGTDPTADSLHLGHYSSLVTAKRLMKMGHKPILLCGGATGRIGDPRPTAEREIISIEVLNHNIECIRKQIDTIFDGNAKLVNNYDWFKGYEFLDFLRDVGKYINVNYMLNKDIINRRLETGITYAEFSYMLIQGYDFLNMYRKMNCVMQVEGSDQWGNITTGIELIKKKTGIAVTPHMLRHYYANERRKVGWSLDKISKALGHKQLATTEAYMDIEDEEMTDIMEQYYKENQGLYDINRLL